MDRLTHAILSDRQDPLTGRVSLVSQCGAEVPSSKAVSYGDFLTLVNQDGASLCKRCLKAVLD